MKKILLVFGTRPEAIKMCPLYIELKKSGKFDCKICLTGQHKEMLSQVMCSFGVNEDYNLNIMQDGQTITTITVKVLEGLKCILEKELPDLVLVHGDTTTSFAASLAAFYEKITVGHVEAGLRTYDKYSPYPEEMNRNLTSRIADFHFAPTQNNAENLYKEGIKDNVYVTGNTVIDALKYTIKKNYLFECGSLNSINYNKKVIVVTAHRRENWGKPLRNILSAIRNIAMDDSVEIVYPLHMNSIIRKDAMEYLDGIDNIHLVEPLSVIDMHNLLSRCFMVMTDSGGLQEEAPSLGKPVLVLRNETERPEAVEAGTVKIVGTMSEDIIKEANAMINNLDGIYNKMACSVNPYGDGKASERISEILSREILY